MWYYLGEVKEHFPEKETHVLFVVIIVIFTFLSKNSCFIILCSFLLYSKVNQLYIHIYPFLDFLPIEVTTER